jgi:hypothetical protein
MSAEASDPAQPETPVQSDAPETAQSTTQDKVEDQEPAKFDDPKPADAPVLNTPWTAPADGNSDHTPAPDGTPAQSPLVESTISADEAAQNPATASQPPGATVLATPDAEKPSTVVAVEQPATIPDPAQAADPDVKPADVQEVPNPNLVTNQSTDIPAPINPDAIGPTPAPITHEEAVAHIAAQDTTIPEDQKGFSSGGTTAVAAAEPTHKGVLDALMMDLEGIAAMGKAEIIALIDIARARLDEL